MIDLRKLVAVDIAFLGRRLILAEFFIGVVGSLGLGVLTFLRSHSVSGKILGAYLISIGINYVPLFLYSIRYVALNNAADEIADEAIEKRRMFRKYRRQSLVLLIPLAAPILVAARELRGRGSQLD